MKKSSVLLAAAEKKPVLEQVSEGARRQALVLTLSRGGGEGPQVAAEAVPQPLVVVGALFRNGQRRTGGRGGHTSFFSATL